MTQDEAKKIGSRQAIKAVLVGILIAQLIMSALSANGNFVKGFFWFVDNSYNLNLFFGATVMLLCGYFFGKRAGFEILVKRNDASWVGFKYGFLTLLSTAFLSGWMGFFQEGLQRVGTDDNPFFDYLFKPLFWVVLFGLIPVVAVGFWFGHQIKKHGGST